MVKCCFDPLKKSISNKYKTNAAFVSIIVYFTIAQHFTFQNKSQWNMQYDESAVVLGLIKRLNF